MRLNLNLRATLDLDIERGGPGATWTIGPVRTRALPERIRPMPFVLLDDQRTTLRASAPIDAAGNPSGAFDAPPTWSVDRPEVLAIAPGADGTSCDAVTTGSLGDAVVSVSAMIGGQAVSETFAITVSVDVPSAFNIVADAPTSRLTPAAPAPA